MSDFPKPDNGKLGSMGRAVTLKEAPGEFQQPQYCSQCGVPGPCKGHYEDKAKQAGKASEPGFQPQPFKVGQ